MESFYCVRNPYLTRSSVVNFISIFLCVFIVKIKDNFDLIPTYIWAYIIFSLIMWILSILISTGYLFDNKGKFNLLYLNFYLIFNIVFGLLIPLNTSLIYFIQMSGEPNADMLYWYINLVILIVNILGLYLFSVIEFEIYNLKNKIIKYIGILLVICSELALFYLYITAPTVDEAYKGFMFEGLFLFAVDLIIARMFLHYSIAKDEINGMD
ncbi:hypothetical protein GCM10010896_16460 [Mammaliicoccus stepanovicii]|uniref:Membrane protein n=2 Tax=Mammaliicoccus stepanovicii TaxID=643214 RepID=A0A239ZDN1_9STAP|nr:hypothetical protein [Mammaliicoccus stepanovicii]GGI42046.1 hypothetical protein GCM10010896_16460 [Mammaliicoccus stepanovicii]SNV68706.1 membrane protein [Mammaliicoccus stepanovicii]